MAEGLQNFIAGRGTAQPAAGDAAGGDDQALSGEISGGSFQQIAAAALPELLNLTAGLHRNVGTLQGKAENVHHTVGLVGEGVYPAGRFSDGDKAQPAEKLQGVPDAELLQGGKAEGGIGAVVPGGGEVKIGQVAAAVAGGRSFRPTRA